MRYNYQILHFSTIKNQIGHISLTSSLEVQLNFILRSFHCLRAISKSALSKIFIGQFADLHIIALDLQQGGRGSTTNIPQCCRI